MPSPVSPDAGVPEHQPDPHRRNRRPQTGGQPYQTPDDPPQTGGRPPSGQVPSGRRQASQPDSGQFQSGQFQSGQFRPSQPRSGQFPSGGQPRSGQFPNGAQPRSGQFPVGPGTNPATPGPNQEPEQPAGFGNGRGGSGKSGGRRDWIWSIVAFVIAAGVIGAVAMYFFGPDDSDDGGPTWAVDACAGPDSAGDAETETYRPMDCDDPEATVTVLEIQDAAWVEQVHCPAGTDVVFQKDGQAGGQTQAVCARNLSDDHPGDPGMGGGQLLAGDCVDGDGKELACTADGARKVTGLIVGANECPDGTVDQLDLGFEARRSYETICLGD